MLTPSLSVSKTQAHFIQPGREGERAPCPCLSCLSLISEMVNFSQNIPSISATIKKRKKSLFSCVPRISHIFFYEITLWCTSSIIPILWMRDLSQWGQWTGHSGCCKGAWNPIHLDLTSIYKDSITTLPLPPSSPCLFLFCRLTSFHLPFISFSYQRRIGQVLFCFCFFPYSFPGSSQDYTSLIPRSLPWSHSTIWLNYCFLLTFWSGWKTEAVIKEGPVSQLLTATMSHCWSGRTWPAMP